MAALKKSGLGKGLDSLITDKVGESNKTQDDQNENRKYDLYVSINKVEPNRLQPRKKFDEDTLIELADSMKQFGVLQPLLVQDKKDYFEIIAGERRWRAAKLAGLKEIPIIIKNLSEQEMVEISLIENIQRENLNAIEEALAYKRLLSEFNLKQDELAERVSKSRTAVTNSIRLLKLDERVQQMVIDDMLTSGHVRTLLALEDKDFQYLIAQQIFDQKLSVRETEKLVRKLQKEKAEKKNEKSEHDYLFIYQDIEEKLKAIMGTKVCINQKDKNKGRIEINYYNTDELERIIDLFQSINKNICS